MTADQHDALMFCIGYTAVKNVKFHNALVDLLCDLETTREAPSADTVEAQRYRKLKRCGAIVDWTHTGPWKFGEDIDKAMDKAIAASVPKGSK